jgi:hypothetical protein
LGCREVEKRAAFAVQTNESIDAERLVLLREAPEPMPKESQNAHERRRGFMSYTLIMICDYWRRPVLPSICNKIDTYRWIRRKDPKRFCFMAKTSLHR